MKDNGYLKEPILVIGNGKMAFSLVVCLLQGGHQVSLYTRKASEARKKINIHLDDLQRFQPDKLPPLTSLKITSGPPSQPREKLVIAVTDEDLSEKKAVLREVENMLPPESVFAINMESFSLDEIQQHASNKERVIGANWAEPAHTTFFLEIITNKHNAQPHLDKFCTLAKHRWQKDPYILRNGKGIRTRMMCAMIREAFYLVDRGYVTLADIDRACRNDPGYYFPFAGNFRYMDLMGTYIYGVVMKDLNPDLSKDSSVPGFFNEIVASEGSGMVNGKGFFEYREEDTEKWEAVFRRFSYQIQEIISKYPFKHTEETLRVKNG